MRDLDYILEEDMVEEDEMDIILDDIDDEILEILEDDAIEESSMNHRDLFNDDI